MVASAVETLLTKIGSCIPKFTDASAGLFTAVVGSGHLNLSFAKTPRATEFHFLTMLQACSQGVDLKADRDFGEGQDKSAIFLLAMGKPLRRKRQ